MVSYKLGICEDGTTKFIDLSSVFKIDNKNSLKSIDKFTSTFNSEYEFKSYLIAKKIISDDDLKRDIKVVYKNNGFINKLPVLYSQDRILLSDIMLKDKIKSLSDNLEFLDELCAFYNRKYYYIGSIIDDIRLYIKDAELNGKIAMEYNSELINSAINDLVDKESKIRNVRLNIYKTNYRGIRDLALFVSTYEKKKKANTITENSSTIDDFSYDFDSAYMRAKEENKWILSSEGDPDFPPNSEEERMYNELQEKLLKLPVYNPHFDDDNDDYEKYK